MGGSQPPLRFDPKVKNVIDEMEYSQIDPILKEEVYYEDQGEYIGTTIISKTDSGIGTSLSESKNKKATNRKLARKR